MKIRAGRDRQESEDSPPRLPTADSGPWITRVSYEGGGEFEQYLVTSTREAVEATIELIEKGADVILVANNKPLAKSVREWSENDLHNLCYTGGTTGLPKGVLFSDRARTA